MNGAWWWNDPDMLVVRGPETSDRRTMAYQPKIPYSFGGWLAGDEYTENEAQFWATVCILSGGIISLSDRLAHLNAKGLRILRTVLPLMSPNAARPIDYWDHSLPGAWTQTAADNSTRLALLNWYDKPQHISVDLAEAGFTDTAACSLRDIWSQKRVVPKKGKVSFLLSQRTAALLVTE